MPNRGPKPYPQPFRPRIERQVAERFQNFCFANKNYATGRVISQILSDWLDQQEALLAKQASKKAS